MKEQLISFETAKLAKEKGFDEPCWEAYGVYSQFGDLKGDDCLQTSFENEFGGTFDEQDYDRECFYLAPTQSLLQKWLRDVHNIFIYVTPTSLGDNAVFIKDCWDKVLLENKDVYNNAVSCNYTYEEALENGLQEGLKLIELS